MDVKAAVLFLVILALDVHQYVAEPTIRIILLRSQIEEGLSHGPKAQDMVKCLVGGTAGEPALSLNYGDMANPPEIGIVKSETHPTGGSLWAETALPRDGWVHCIVVDDSGTYEEQEYLSVKVCPNIGAIELRQIGKISRPQGHAVLNCFFRFPENDLSYYMWMIKKNNMPFYTFSIDTENEDRPPRYASLLIDEKHIITKDTVNSTVRLSVNLTDANTYRCEATLKTNFNNDCAKEANLTFADPSITIEVLEPVKSFADPQQPNMPYAVICNVDHASGKPSMSVAYLNYERRWKAITGLASSGANNLSWTGRYFAQSPFTKNTDATIACNVTDSRGAYHKQTSAIHSSCPRVDVVTIQQTSPVPYPRGMVDLLCSVASDTQELRELSWMFAGNRSLIYSFNFVTGKESRVFGAISKENQQNRIRYRLQMLMGLDDVNTVTCTVSSVSFLNCSRTHRVEFEFQEDQHETTLGLPFTAVCGFFALFVIIVLVLVALYIRRRKHRYQAKKYPSVTYRQLLSPKPSSGDHVEWGEVYATVLPHHGRNTFILEDEDRPIKKITLCYGHWNNRSVLGAIGVIFQRGETEDTGEDKWKYSTDFDSIAKQDMNKRFDYSAPSEEEYIAGVQVRDGHMVDQITLFEGPTLQQIKFGFEQGGELHPFESKGWLIGVRGCYQRKDAKEDGDFKTAEDKASDFQGITHLQFKWAQDEGRKDSKMSNRANNNHKNEMELSDNSMV